VALWPGRAPVGEKETEEANAFLTVHRPAAPNGAAVVICPGGGYGGLVTEGEGHGIARWLNAHGITGLVLEYRLPAGRPMVPLLDAQRALRTARANAKDWGIDPGQIGIIGFSAGGHLASTAATHFDDGQPAAEDPVERLGCRPDFAILVYPVITMGEQGHAGSRANLLGPSPSAELIERFSNERQVAPRTPPTYLAHAVDDRVVPAEHSRMFLAALRQHSVPAEYLELPSGDHGLNGYKGPMWDAWQAGSLKWLAEQKCIPASERPSASAPLAPVKVFLLAGQSNMEGQAVADLDGPDYNGGRGTLVDVLRDPRLGARFAGFQKVDGRWPVRDDVWVRYQREKQPLLKGPLGVGFGAYDGGHHFGPELAFGHAVGNALDAPVLLVKTAWGGRSLYTDFRPPSSGGPVGPYYRKMIDEVREALAGIPEDFPALAGRGHELAGLVWYHGWNDGCEPQTAVPEYERNLVHLIKDVRRDLQAPDLPVVIGELTGPWVEAPDEWGALRRAQAAAAGHPEFAGTVAFVETHDFVRRPEDSPNPGHGHHEFGNAETYLRVGDALGQAMLELTGAAVPGFAPQTIEGWRVHLSRRLLEEQSEAVATALPLLRRQLQEIVRVVPAAAVARLREVPLWFSPEYDGVPGRAEYHPGAEWLRENGRLPAMVKSVEFTDTRNFEAETLRMPNFTLHELAHAYHDRILGFDQPDIADAFENARAAGLYDRVQRRHRPGQPETVERAYAMTDAKEYFAELTEALFSTNDYFPFTRQELDQHDPRGAAVVRKVWGVTP
jgi:acetyl esterase/lipase